MSEGRVDMFSRRQLLLASALAPLVLSGCKDEVPPAEELESDLGPFKIVSPYDGPRCSALVQGIVASESQLSRSSAGHKATSTNLVLVGDCLYVGGNTRVRAIDALTGEGIRHHDFKARSRGAGRLAVCGDILLAAFGDGGLAALGRDDFDLLWEQELDLPLAEWGRREDADGNVSLDMAPALWYIANIAVHEGLAFVGFSSYQVSPGSHLICVEVASGSVLWTKTYEGRFCYSWGVGHPCAADAGLLVPRPEERGAELLAYETGEVICALDTGWIGMGITPIPDAEADYLCASMEGELYRLRVDGSSGITRVSCCQLPTDGEERLLPSSAQPVVAGSYVICNNPAPVKRGDSGRAFPDEAEGHSVSVIDLNTFEVVATKENMSFDATPVVIKDEGVGDLQLVYLQESGLWSCPIDDSGLGNATRLNGEVPCGTDTPQGPFVITEEGHVLIAGGTTEVQYLYRVS